MSHAPDRDILAVLDPARSAVVEACAGSGKTWLLAARIVRLLLSGAQPGEILAITFTRKAAREIEERVVGWLRWLATAGDAEAAAFLRERGGADDGLTLARARGLYERVSEAQPGLAVSTFHGWFLQLVAAAPLSAGLTGARLADDGSRRFDELWQSFAAQLQQAPESPAAAAFVRLLTVAGRSATRQLIKNGMARRAEWLVFAGDGAGSHEAWIAELHDVFGDRDEAAVLADFFSPGWEADFLCYLGFLEASSLETDRRLAQQLAEALTAVQKGERGRDSFAALFGTVLTKEGTLRVRKLTKALEGRLGADAARFLDLHAALGARLLRCELRLQDARSLELNRDAFCVHAAFLAHLAAFKAERRQIDFVDAEWEVLRLLGDETNAAYLQARLDARYRHVLLDEFQDTNPLQWRILQSWLAAYAASDGERPTVFMVGDPKQSIYRFRGADPRLFVTAAGFLQSEYAAVAVARDVTRRNAPPIIDVVNALFSVEPAFVPFRPQHAAQLALPGFVELLPLSSGEEGAPAEEAPNAANLRNPLLQPAGERCDRRREREAAQLAERLQAMIGKSLIRDGDNERPLGAGDVMLLVRSRTQIAVYERALAAAGVPYVAASRGGLLDSLEVRDIAALLEFLVTPAADLALAHVLRSPLFACSDADLQVIATRPGKSWWQRLNSLMDIRSEGLSEGSGEGASRGLVRATYLLTGWLADAPKLPAHDLLDRIYDSGEVMARYRLAVPESRRAAALANLEALLLLALDLDGGRYPSLPRFIDELRALRRAGDDDAPDEGELTGDNAVAAEGRVRILTIHGAKGLEAPLVWLLDANATPRPEGGWTPVVDWPPGAPAPTHFSFVGRRADAGEARAALFAAEVAAAEREELNLLYVAITRARQVFMASGIDSSRTAQTTPYARLRAALSRLGAVDPARHGALLPEVTIEPDADLPAPLRAPSLEALPTVPAVGERRVEPDAAARFGILLHAILERRVPGQRGLSPENSFPEGDSPWWQAMGYSESELASAMPVAERLLAAPTLRRFFDPACYRRAWNEVEIATNDGQLFRIDRLVEDDEAVWVLDYKSSGPDSSRLAEYRAQVAAYCLAIRGVFAMRPVRGVIVFADASIIPGIAFPKEELP